MDQEWNAKEYAERASFVSELGRPVLQLLSPAAGERILDLGCGDGTLAAAIRQAGAEVVGVDKSPDMVVAAQVRGIDARLADAHKLAFDNEFDAVFSNAALHWMTRPEEAVRGVARALCPGGRFVGEFGGHGNVAAIVTALIAAWGQSATAKEPPRPWYFPTAEEYEELLERHGFRVETIGLIPRPTRLAAGMEAWLETFAGPFVNAVPPDKRAAYVERVITLLRRSLCDESSNWTADYVRLRFRAYLDE
jgi:trans-aconitate methyltransferase